MTKHSGEEERPGRCRWCRRPLPSPGSSVGRPREYCRRSCRQRAYEARRRVLTLGLSADLCIVRSAELDRLHELARSLDAAWTRCAVAVDNAAEVGDLAAVCRAVAELGRAAEPLRHLVVVPAAD